MLTYAADFWTISASDDASFVHGAILAVDGGRTAA
jgi:hypothetical protein